MPTVLVNGEPIYYQQHKGDPARPPLVLIHGAGGDHMHWPHELRRLPGYSVYALDLPGHGKSGGQGQASVPAYADVVRGFAGALRLSPFVLAGHSMGGAITQQVALTWPERLAGVVLVGTGARLRVMPQILDGIVSDFAGTTSLIATVAHGEGVEPKHMDEYVRRLRQTPASVIQGDYRACDVFDRRADISRIGVPALIICGTADRLTPPKYSQWLAGQLPAAQLVLVPGAGHMVMLERPAEVAQAVAGFLAGLTPRR